MPILDKKEINQEDPFKEIGTAVTPLNPQSETNIQQYSFLIVENEVGVRDNIRRTLESAHHMVIVTHDATQAIDFAVGLLPDAIILNTELPNTDGWELLRQLKQQPQIAAIPVMVCTANDDQQRALDLGA